MVTTLHGYEVTSIPYTNVVQHCNCQAQDNFSSLNVTLIKKNIFFFCHIPRFISSTQTCKHLTECRNLDVALLRNSHYFLKFISKIRNPTELSTCLLIGLGRGELWLRIGRPLNFFWLRLCTSKFFTKSCGYGLVPLNQKWLRICVVTTLHGYEVTCIRWKRRQQC